MPNDIEAEAQEAALELENIWKPPHHCADQWEGDISTIMDHMLRFARRCMARELREALKEMEFEKDDGGCEGYTFDIITRRADALEKGAEDA